MAMGSYRRAKLALDVARGFTARISPNAASREPISHVFSTALSTPASNAAKFSGFPFNSSILHKSLGGTTTTTPYKSPSLCRTIKRDYCVHRNAVREFKRFEDRLCCTLALIIGVSCILILWYLTLENRIGENLMHQEKASFEGKILPAIDTWRVSWIANDIIDKSSKTWKEIDKRRKTWKEIDNSRKMGKEIDNSRKTWMERVSKADTSHLDHLNWEVLVVDDPVAEAYSMPGGKIVVSTELLKLFGSDVEIATIIGHEVGHAVARHFAEILATESWLDILLFGFLLRKMKLQFVKHDVKNLRMEIEADQIGILLVAYAGYDPRMVPAVYEKMGKFEDSNLLDRCHSYNPSWKERAQLLSQAKVMDDALAIYQDVRAARRY